MSVVPPQRSTGRAYRQTAARILFLLFCVLCTSVIVADGAPLGGMAARPRSDNTTLVIPINKSRIIDLRAPIARVSIANPAIADILVINPTQVYINGKQLGTTNMILWDDGDDVQGQIALEVTHDLQSLKEKLHRFLPGERIRVESAQGAIVMTGEVSSAVKLDAALRLARSYAGGELGGGDGEDGRVINLLQVGGAQQVLLEVKVAEVNRNLTRRLDIDFTGLYDGGSIKIGAVNGGAEFPDFINPDGLRVLPFAMNPGVDGIAGPAIPEFNPGAATITDAGVFANYLGGNFYFNIVLDLAKARGLARILAEPNLTTLSGEEAEFLSGGEFPVPVPGDDGAVTIEYKAYGVSLKFLPFVLDSGLISLNVNVSVSEISNDTAIALAPAETSAVTVVPSLRKRGANATVEVPSGRAIAIAGLLSETTSGNVDRFPGLGDLPIIGPLFRSQQYQTGQSELIIFVTPRLARPISPDQITLPTDGFVEPSDVEFYLRGRLEGRRAGESPSAPRRLGPDRTGAEGPFGHDL